MRPQRRVLTRTSLLIGACAVVFAGAAAGQDAAPELADPGSQDVAAEDVAVAPGVSAVSAVSAVESAGEAGDAAEQTRVAIVPFRLHSARSLGTLTESLAELLAARLEATGRIEVVDSTRLEEVAPGALRVELLDSELREVAERLGARAVVTGSLTSLAGRFSLDVRVTPASAEVRSRSIIITADSEEELIGRLDELAERVEFSVLSAAPPQILAIELIGATDLRDQLSALLVSRVGERYDSGTVRADRDRLEEQESVASATVETQRGEAGISLTFTVVRIERLFGEVGRRGEGMQVAEIIIQGNRRIESDAIRARIGSRVGEPARDSQIAADVRAVFELGFFGNVTVSARDGEEGRILTFLVEENPVVRQISIEGNENVDGEKIRDALTLTTGSTLDYPLLHENVSRVEALYRAEGYYLANVEYQIERLSEGSIGINFEVLENEKLRLKTIAFEGNEAFDDKELEEEFATKRWRFWSWATSWFDKSGTYSEPVFLRDLRTIEKTYTDNGYLQVEVGEPLVDPAPEGLSVTVPIREGPQFRVGSIDVSGDATIDLEALRGKLALEDGAVFNRSHLTSDVEILTEHYTDRGFYFASVQPRTALSQEDLSVDVKFHVEKGPLYFVRKVEISGNTRTVDEVIRREMRLTEGELYSARGLKLSNLRLRGLGFFEDVQFEMRPTQDPSQLDLDVSVVERPTGSFSFGAGYSSQDKLVLTAGLSQSNLFGRGYAVNLSADIGGQTNRFFFSFSDPYFLDTEFSLGLTVFLTQVEFDDFTQRQVGLDLNVGHALTEDNRTRLFLRYTLANRKVQRDISSIGAATILREIQQGGETTSMIGLSLRGDTRDDRFAPTSGIAWGATLDYAGIGGFTNFLRVEGRFAAYLGAPSWLFDRSTFVFATRLGYALPLNEISDFGSVIPSETCVIEGCGPNIKPLDQIDTDLRLPLTERYFLGGIGGFQLRGYKSRSLGPRRSILTTSSQTTGRTVYPDYYPIGRTPAPDDQQGGRWTARCTDTNVDPISGCNKLGDTKNSDFANLLLTDVVGGSSFISTSLEYRFPISEEIGLQGVVFVDMGNSFAEKQNLFDVTQWRYGTGAGVLWFSPFGPLQVVLGFPINPLSIEKSPVFEFSVGGVGL